MAATWDDLRGLVDLHLEEFAFDRLLEHLLADRRLEAFGAGQRHSSWCKRCERCAVKLQ